MIDVVLNMSKVSIRSVFTAKKYDAEILDEDLRRILFIRNLIEESSEYVKNHHKEIDAELYARRLKEYALELFLEQCKEARSDDDDDCEDLDFDEQEYFNYIYQNLEYPD